MPSHGSAILIGSSIYAFPGLYTPPNYIQRIDFDANDTLIGTGELGVYNNPVLATNIGTAFTVSETVQSVVLHHVPEGFCV